MVTALLLQAIDKEKVGSTGLLRFKVRWSWLVAWILPVALVVLSVLVNSLFKGVELGYFVPATDETPDMFASPKMFIAMTIVSGLFAGLTINARNTDGETTSSVRCVTSLSGPSASSRVSCGEYGISLLS